MLALIAALAGVRQLLPSGMADHTSCEPCVLAGFGWSVSKQKCGGFKNKECPSAAACGAEASADLPDHLHARVGNPSWLDRHPRWTDAAGGGWYGDVRVAGGVPRRVWDRKNPRFAEEVIAGGRPVIFTGTPADDWPALGGKGSTRWSNAYLRRKLDGRQIWTQESSTSNFLYWRVTDLRPKFSGYVEPTTHFWMQSSEFVDGLEAGRPLYYNKLIDGNSPLRPVLMEVYPFEFATSTGRMQSTTGHFWWGAGGIRSTPHYDQSQNFFVQIFGRKRFLLSSPGNYSGFYFYPLSHPSGRHSALDWPHRAE
jgi:hypothetical protein